uniref:pyruvate, phosphate dikinase n=1 Tax=uncultured Gemmiger sp. TaxID=1623490 RepID=UPI0025CE6E68
KMGTKTVWNDNCEMDGVEDRDAQCDFEGKKGTMAELKILHSNLMAYTAKQALADVYPGERPYIINRAGYAGIQRYAQVWGGDNLTDWRTVKFNIATILGMGLSGCSNMGCDIGGFAGPAPEAELLLRWIQNGIFQPRFCMNSANNDNTVTQPWMYEENLPYVREAYNLRYRLLPYLYSLMYESNQDGMPAWRPLFLEFPQDPKEQLIGAVKAVFRSWDNPRANVYRKMNEIPYEWGTAVNVQQMAFGNSGMRSGTGVAFTRNPATGEKKLMGEYLINAQGEDVVAGIRTPSPISKLHEEMPEVYDQFVEIATRLENYYKDMQDMEFTIEDGKLFMLQTRNGKRTAQAALQIACDLVDEGVIDEKTAVLRVEPKQLDTLLHPQFDAAALKAAEAIGKGLAASPGSACGRVVFSAEDAEEKVKDEAWKKVVLVRLETSPEDIVGMQVSQGILTVRGGMTSHAAVVARGMGTCCVSGCGNDNDVAIDYDAKVITINGHTFHEGDWMSIDGSTGNIYEGQIATVASTENANFKRFMGWADANRQMKVMTNADNPRDAQNAVDMGAEGIGLCRTEHMFFAEDRIAAVREMICARTVEERKTALAKVEPFQEADFTAMYRIMGERPMTIRYLDPPLHEFLPTKAEDIAALAKDMGMTTEELNNVVVSLHEFNPMMGHRGCRLAVTYPEIAEMQTNAVIKAALKVSAETGKMITPHIMVPLVGEVKELKFVKDVIVKTADALIAAAGVDMKYEVGTMIEIPRAALTAGEIAKEADFFSFGTNDLTQMTFGFSRDDAAKFLTAYYDNKIYESDPFQHLDQIGVGKLVKMAAADGRATNPNLGLGICGEHGGDPSSVEFCHNVGLDYVSCSPFRVPIARLAAAQAAIKNPRA